MGNKYSSPAEHFCETKGNYRNPIRVVTLGSTLVGKTSIIAQILSKKLPTCKDEVAVKENQDDKFTLTVISGDNDTERIRFFDTSSKVTKHVLRRCIAHHDVFLIVYSLDREASFDDARNIVNEIKEQRPGEDVPILLLGNKNDICKEQREISTEVADLLSIDWDVTEHIFMSATSHEDTEKVLKMIIGHAKRCKRSKHLSK